MAEFASKGVAGSGLGLGIAGTALGLLNGGGVGGILSPWLQNGAYCNMPMATKSDIAFSNSMAEKDARIASLEADRNTDAKLLELYKYLDAKDKATGEAIAALAGSQAVTNQKVADNFVLYESQFNALKRNFDDLTRTIIPTTSICNTCCNNGCNLF